MTGGARLSHPNVVPLAVCSNKTQDMGRSSKTNPLNAMGLDHAITPPGGDPEYIMQLVNDVRKFSDALLSLEEAFQYRENQECLQHVVDERLGELVRVLKAVIGKHQALNSAEILGAAGTVIAKVKGLNVKEVNKDNKDTIFGEICTTIDNLAFTFGNVVSDFLMGDVDNGCRLGFPQTRSHSFENLSDDSEGCHQERNYLAELSPVEQVDLLLLRNDRGVESALLFAKAWSKYTKDVLGWVEKRLSLDMECAKSFAKMAESARAVASQQDYMPFQDIYVSAFKNEIEYNQVLLQTAAALQTNKFIQPLLARKNDLDKQRKEIKEQWQRELKKMTEAESAVKKAHLLKGQKREEYEKARSSTSRTEEEQPATGGRTLEKKRRVEEEALLRNTKEDILKKLVTEQCRHPFTKPMQAEEAQEQYKASVADLEARKVGLANAKSEILAQIRKLVFQCDLTLKAVTVNWFQMQQAQTVPLPVNYQALCEQAKKYEPGQRYSEFVCSLPKERVWLESLSQDITAPSKTGMSLHKRSVSSTHSSHGNLSQGSVTSGDNHSADEVEGTATPFKTKIGERRSNSSGDIAVRTQGSQRVWSTSSGGGGGTCSDSESAGGSSESRSMDSPTASPGDFKRRLPRTPSTGTMSSADDLDEREPLSPLDNGLAEIVMVSASSPGPFRNAQMSKAAHTHKLRKLRAPSKCRECDGLVVFHGAECEECSLACHKKCLETLAIQCGHKKLQGRLHLFGIDFAQVAKNSADGIPFIIKKCTSEIESRALNVKGIYRVNGAKSRVEKLCQAFENGKDLVELSDLHPHDISNVLKLYLRQLPEPLILYRYYNDVIGLAKETQNVLADEPVSAKNKSSGEQLCLSIELKRVIFKIRDLLRQLPAAHYRTLQFLIAHLHRVSEQAEENKMTASNLGIIFGPTLIKPRQLDAEVSLSSLVDYPHQARMVELLISHQHMIFDAPLSPMSPTNPTAPHVSIDKEPKLSRHSRSLMDIKESAKVYKRHSSVITSQLLAEVKEMKTGADRAQTSAGVGSDINGVGPAEAQKTTSVFGQPSASTRAVQMRPPRSKQVSRPISMPVDRLLNERNSRNNAEQEHPPAAIPGTTEPDKPLTPRPTSYYRNPFIDTQMLRRTWDKQYRHYNVTPRTAMIVAKLPSSDVTDSVKSSAEIVSGTACGVSVTPNSSPHITGGGQSCTAPISFRAPRTLKPPPGTFYKPGSQFRSFDSVAKTDSTPSTNSAGVIYTTAITIVTTAVSATVATIATTVASPPTTPTSLISTATTAAKPSITTLTMSVGSISGEAEEGLSESESLSSATHSPPHSPSSSAEELSPTGTKPLYQRRSRRMQEMELREAHFV